MASSPTPLNILSLDGGGVRGLSSLYILKYLMEQLQRHTKSPKVLLPCEVFDLICGTSTGGLIALMLGRLRMTVDESIRCYEELSEQIFGKKRPFYMLRRLAGGAMFDAVKLEECFKTIISKHDTSGKQDALLEHPLPEKGQHFCRTFVVATYANRMECYPQRLRSYSTNKANACKCKIWEAARATTAATTYFDPIEIHDQSGTSVFIDGALAGANNPSLIARHEAFEVFPDRPIGCFVSLGTGVPSFISMKGYALQLIKASIRVVTSCEQMHHFTSRDFQRHTPPGERSPYFRFSANLGHADIALHGWKLLGKIKEDTNLYMEGETQEWEALQCVKALNDEHNAA